MHEYRPHTFDTRGCVYALLSLGALVVVLGVSVKYGSALAQEHLFREPQLAASAQPSERESATLEEAQEVELSKKNVASLFTISDTPPPKVSAKAFVVGDVASNAVFAHKKAVETYPIASVTKLLTALVARETLGVRTIDLTTSDRQKAEGYPGTIGRDESFSLNDALHALLMESNNSIANALSRTGGGETFMNAMRAKAKEIGMDSTTLEDPSGISAHNAASALDVMVLIQHLYDSAPDLLDFAREGGAAITAKSGRTYHLGNYNVFFNDPHFVGGKIGYTGSARQTYASIFEVPVGEETALIAIVVLGSENHRGDTEALLKWFKKSANVSTSTIETIH